MLDENTPCSNFAEVFGSFDGMKTKCKGKSNKKKFGPPDPSSVKQRNMVTMLANTNGSQTKSRTLVPSVTQKKNVQPSRPCTMSPTNSYIQKKPLLVEPPSTTLHAMI